MVDRSHERCFGGGSRTQMEAQGQLENRGRGPMASGPSPDDPQANGYNGLMGALAAVLGTLNRGNSHINPMDWQGAPPPDAADARGRFLDLHRILLV